MGHMWGHLGTLQQDSTTAGKGRNSEKRESIYCPNSSILSTDRCRKEEIRELSRARDEKF